MTITDVREKYDHIYRASKDDLMKICMKVNGYNKMLAEDAVQEGFAMLYMAMRKEPEKITEPRAYAIMCAKNYMKNEYRKLQKECLYGEMEIIEEEFESTQAAEEEYLSEEEIKTFQQAIEFVKENNETWHYILTEANYYSRTQKEIAQELGISESGVYNMMRKMRRWAKKNMVEYREELE